MSSNDVDGPKARIEDDYDRSESSAVKRGKHTDFGELARSCRNYFFS